MPAAHRLPRKGHDRDIMNQALQDRVAAGPADAVERDVAVTDGGNKKRRCKPRQENAVIGGVKTDSSKHTIEPRPKQLRDALASGEFDKRKLAAGNLDSNAREHAVELRQIFRQGLTAPIGDGIGT